MCMCMYVYVYVRMCVCVCVKALTQRVWCVGVAVVFVCVGRRVLSGVCGST